MALTQFYAKSSRGKQSKISPHGTKTVWAFLYAKLALPNTNTELCKVRIQILFGDATTFIEYAQCTIFGSCELCVANNKLAM